jgi:hypothetical protein
MDAASSSVLEKRSQRVVLLRELVTSFQQTQRAIVLSDLQAMPKHFSHQQELCRQLLALGPAESEHLPSDCGPAEHHRWNILAKDLEQLEQRARHLARVQESLLRRSRRAQDLMARLVATTALTYTPPPGATRSAAAGE